MIGLLLAPMSFAQPQFGAQLAVESVINDPFVASYGVRTGFTVAPAPFLELGASVAYYPIFAGDSGCNNPRWTALACQLLEENSVSPDISFIEVEAEAEVRVLPLRAHLGNWETAFGLSAGLGLVSTHDDLIALQAEGEPAAQATEDQIHPAGVGGFIGDVRTKHFGVRLRVHDITYIETVNSTTLEMKHNILTATEVNLWF